MNSPVDDDNTSSLKLIFNVRRLQSGGLKKQLSAKFAKLQGYTRVSSSSENSSSPPLTFEFPLKAFTHRWQNKI